MHNFLNIIHSAAIAILILAGLAESHAQDTLSLCFMGDVMVHSRQIEYARQKDSTYDFSSCFSQTHKQLQQADIAVANMEFTLAGKPYTGYPQFSAPDEMISQLAADGFDVLLAANNHIYDKGAEGTARTHQMLKKAQEKYGILFCGLAGSKEERDSTTPLIIKKEGFTIALINFTYGTNLGAQSHWPKTNYESEKEMLKAAFEKAREEGAEIIIALPHWGEEYVLHHSERQEQTARWLVENGADIIIGSHPHVVQDFGTIRQDKDSTEVPVAYSLGNAVSNMSAANTQIGLIATVRVARSQDGTAKILPVVFTYTWCSRPGGYNNSYTVIPVKENLETRSLWVGEWEYDKMKRTYYHILQETGIPDGITEVLN